MSEPAPTVLPSSALEKALLSAALILGTFGGYYTIAHFLDPARARSLATPLDDWIPFSAVFTWGYTICYTSLLIPVFTTRCQRLFRRVCVAYLLVVVVCLICYAVYPVTAQGLRPDLSGAEYEWFHVWGLRLNYHLDPPLNLFPSLHVGVAFVAAGCAWKTKRSYGYLAIGIAVLVSASVCLVKQHFVLDVVSSAALAGAAYALVLRPYDRGDAPEEAVAHGWRGPMAYAVFHSSVLLVLYICFKAGLKPW